LYSRDNIQINIIQQNKALLRIIDIFTISADLEVKQVNCGKVEIKLNRSGAAHK
jgi:hypothetical protein